MVIDLNAMAGTPMDPYGHQDKCWQNGDTQWTPMCTQSLFVFHRFTHGWSADNAAIYVHQNRTNIEHNGQWDMLIIGHVCRT